MWGRGLVENVIWGGGGWLKTSEYRYMEGEGSKIAQKPSYDISTFPKETNVKLPNLVRIRHHAGEP